MTGPRTGELTPGLEQRAERPQERKVSLETYALGHPAVTHTPTFKAGTGREVVD